MEALGVKAFGGAHQSRWVLVTGHTGFSVLPPLKDDSTVWEAGPLSGLAAAGELMVSIHDGVWQTMDALRDKQTLGAQWGQLDSGAPPWKVWP